MFVISFQNYLQIYRVYIEINRNLIIQHYKLRN